MDQSRTVSPALKHFCRISELPSFVYEWFWDTVTLSNLPLPPPETSGRVLGGLLHVVHFVTRYSVLRSQKVEEGDWQDMQREIHIVAGLEQEDPEPWFSWVCPSGLAHISY
jgi:hypothetical protein